MCDSPTCVIENQANQIISIRKRIASHNAKNHSEICIHYPTRQRRIDPAEAEEQRRNVMIEMKILNVDDETSRKSFEREEESEVDDRGHLGMTASNEPSILVARTYGCSRHLRDPSSAICIHHHQEHQSRTLADLLILL